MSTQGNPEQWSQPQNPFPVQPDQQDAGSDSQDPSLSYEQQSTAQSQPAYQPASQNVDPSAPDATATDDNSLAKTRSQAQQQVNNAIDQLAQKIPGGDRIAKQAKDAASGILDSLEQQGGKLIGNLGGIFGGQKDKP